MRTATPEEIAAMPAPKEAITNKTSFIISTIIFLCAIVLLVSHAETGLTVSTIGVFIALLTLITSGKNAINLLKKVDYKTLLFFVGLFIVVGGLEQTGILKLIAEFIGKVSGGNVMLMIAIILWVSAIASAFIDNIPFAATMIPIIKTLAVEQGVALPILAWALALGTDLAPAPPPLAPLPTWSVLLPPPRLAIPSPGVVTARRSHLLPFWCWSSAPSVCSVRYL